MQKVKNALCNPVSDSWEPILPTYHNNIAEAQKIVQKPFCTIFQLNIDNFSCNCVCQQDFIKCGNMY